MNETETVKTQVKIFHLILAAGDVGRLRAAELIRSLDAKARRDLRATCQVVDELVDDVALAEMRERRPWKL